MKQNQITHSAPETMRRQPEQQGLNLVLAVDGSRYSEAAVQIVRALTWRPETSVRVIAVIPDAAPFSLLSADAQHGLAEVLSQVREEEQRAAEMLTARVAEQLRAAGLHVETRVCRGLASQLILDELRALGSDLVVIGAKGLSAPTEFHLGSTAHKVAHYADCSVLVARPLPHERVANILFAADGSPASLRAAEFLCALALPRWVEVTVVGVAEFTVLTPAGESRPVANVPELMRQVLLDGAEERAAQVIQCLAKGGMQVRRSIRIGHPSGEILAAAQELDADLIVMGARGMTQAEPFPIGGVAQKVVKYAPCSVLIVRQARIPMRGP